jgi:hypothetical protein
MQTGGIKEQARRLLESLPDSATWEDLIYQIYVRQAIEAGIKDSDEGKTVDVKEVRITSRSQQIADRPFSGRKSSTI